MSEKLKIAGTTYLKFKKGNVTTKGEEGEKHVKARIIDYGKMEGQTIHEVQMDSATGLIDKVQMITGEYGEELIITMKDAIGKVFVGAGTYEEREMELAVVSVSVESMGYFETLATKLPNLNMSKEVTFKPYDFIPKGKEKSNVGVSITQDEEKITDFFRDDKNKAINGAPEPDFTSKENPDGKHDNWKEFFEARRKFLKKYIRKNIAEEEVKEEEGMVEED